MNRIGSLRTMAGVLLLALAGSAPAAVPADTDAEPAAVAVVEAYLNALSTADVPTMLSTLSPTRRAEQRRTVESASYVDLLTRLYAGSSFTVDGAKPAPEGGVVVKTSMLLAGGYTTTFRFLVQRQPDGTYKIAEER